MRTFLHSHTRLCFVSFSFLFSLSLPLSLSLFPLIFDPGTQVGQPRSVPFCNKLPSLQSLGLHLQYCITLRFSLHIPAGYDIIIFIFIPPMLRLFCPALIWGKDSGVKRDGGVVLTRTGRSSDLFCHLVEHFFLSSVGTNTLRIGRASY